MSVGTDERFVEIERKFLLATCPDWTHPLLAAGRHTRYEQIYLQVSDEREDRIRRLSSADAVRYEHTRLFRIRPGVREVVEDVISAAEYERLRLRRDGRRNTVIKDRLCFQWRGQGFELDDIHQPASRSCQLLEIELTAENQEVVLPDFLNIDREVTYEGDYANSRIALG
jgi:CYTH domain-containing protein